MIPFLQSVAEAYVSRFKRPDSPAPLDYCFVFPNKRAGTFFLNHLRNVSDADIIAPAVTTISDLIASLSGRIIGQRIDLLFLLYRTYLSLLQNKQISNPSCPTSDHLPGGENRGGVSFDAFRKWGDTLLRDFNEVDMQNVDPDAIFKNIADFRRISSTFLTPEQRAVIEEYFGYSPTNYDDSKFWQDFDNDISSPNLNEDLSVLDGAPNEMRREKANIRSKFVYLWKIMAPLYHAFNRALDERGLATSGGAYRLALQRLETAFDSSDSEKEIFRLLPYSKVVMVGFNALSTTERAIFSLLQRLPSPAPEEEHLTDFIWDATGPILTDKSNSAGRFVAINRREYPSPAWTTPYIMESETRSLPPVLEAISAPSKVMQIKVATEIIADLLREKGEQMFEDARVALVVPDESLIIPLLYSIPKEIGKVNLTMGYSLRLTAVNSFLSLIRSLQLSPRNASSYRGYAYEQLRDLLSHPYAHAIFSTKNIRRFCADMERRHISVVREHDLDRLGKNARQILRQLDPDTPSVKVIRYLDELLTTIEDSLYNVSSNMLEGRSILKGSLEREHVRAWREALRRFEESIAEYDIQMNATTTLAEAFRLLRGESVAFEGEPLSGLQIMGMLETRALDFDHLIMVGLNDRTIPGRGNSPSFIPNVIRRGFGMPPNAYQEELFAYYFFRLISRCESARLIYDSRIDGRNGGESRYLLQLRYLYARSEMKDVEYKFDIASRSPKDIVIVKTPDIMERLERYCREPAEEERRFNLSASLIKKYVACPLKFYYSGILDLKDDPLPSPAVDNITFGNIIHSILQHLYIPDVSLHKKWLDSPAVVDADLLNRIIENKDGILDTLARRTINKEHYHLKEDALDSPLQPDTELIAEAVKEYVIDVARYDLKRAPFKIFGVEIAHNYDYYLSSGRRVNMRYAIDRVDNADCAGSSDVVRVIDYKTGDSNIVAESVESLINDDYRKDNLLQLVIYAQLLNLHRCEEGDTPLLVRPRIYPVGRLHPTKKPSLQTPGMLVAPYIAGEEVDIINPVVEEFTPVFDSLLEEIFNPDIPFRATTSPTKCTNCIFYDSCRTAD